MLKVKSERAGGKKISAVDRAARQEDEIDQATFAIGRKIQRKGIKARQPLQTSLKNNTGFIKEIFESAAVEVGRELEGT